MAAVAETHAQPTSLGRAFPTRKPASLWSDAWRRLLRNRASMVGLGIIAFFALVALLAPLIAPHNALQYYAGNTFRAPAWVTLPNDPRTGDWRFPLGTDAIGRDVLSRLIFGTRTSMIAGFIPMFIIVSIGTLIGMIAGFAGGRVDNLLMRFTDVVYAFPDLLFIIIMMTALRDTAIGNLLNGLVLLFVSLSIVNWVTVARLVRGQVLSLKEKEFIEAAHMIGASNRQIMWRHLLPNSLAPIIVAAAFAVPQAILAEAVLGYLGLGMRPPTDPNSLFPTSWGCMLLEGRDAINAQVWLLLSPAICIATIMLSFTFLGDGLRDALDPMMRGRS
ncbi:MAG: ABC transporter permease [Chloroflexota bacterium]